MSFEAVQAPGSKMAKRTSFSEETEVCFASSALDVIDRINRMPKIPKSVSLQ